LRLRVKGFFGAAGFSPRVSLRALGLRAGFAATDFTGVAFLGRPGLFRRDFPLCAMPMVFMPTVAVALRLP